MPDSGGGKTGAAGELLEVIGELLTGFWRLAVRLRPVVSGFCYRYRTQLRPVWVLAALAAGRWGASLESVSPGGVLTVSLLAVSAIVFRSRGRLDRPAEWVYAASCSVAAVTGLTLTAALGTDQRWLNTAAVIGWVTGACVWWAHHAGGSGPPLIEEPGAIMRRWDKHIRHGTGPMKGAVLTGPVPFDHGDTYSIQLVPYTQTIGTLQSDAVKISSGLRTPQRDLILEQHPDFPDDPTMARMQHVTRSPIKETIYFDRPRHEDGWILLGPHADGIGEARLRLYTEDEESMWSTSLTGGTGIGKSRLIETIAITALAMRDTGQHTVIFYMDGQNGASSPVLFKNATWPVGTDGVLPMLAAIERIADWRQKENRAHEPEPLNGFVPSAARPGILVVIDEAHLVLRYGAERFAALAKSIRKLGIAFFVAAHDSSLKTLLDDSLRAALLGGNGLVMHVDSRIVGNLIPGLDTNPADLPKIPGYGVLVGAAGTDIRTAPYRGRWAPNEREKVRAEARGRPVSVATIEEWFTRYSALELDRGAARAAGRDYTERATRAEADLVSLRRSVNGDLPEDPAGDDRELSDVVGADLVTAGDGPKGTCAQRIMALDWDRGDLALQQIFEAIPDLNVRTVTTALQGLMADEVLDRPQRAVYRRVGVRA